MFNNFPPFSVLMSVYYKENPQYLNESLNSIAVQTILPTEIVLVEDGPLSSELYKVINKYKVLWKTKLKVVKISKNGGLGPALRKGTNYVSTNWIARMDTDDISVPNRFEIQLKEIIKNPDYAVVGGQIDEFVSNVNNVVGGRKVPLEKKDIYEFIQYRNPFNHPTVMINKRKLLKVGGYKASDRLEDYDLWVRFVKDRQKLKNVNNILVHMRVGNDLYKRRGGLRYLNNYIHMKNHWRKEGIGNYKSMIYCDAIMVINTLIPNKIRKIIYRKILHKK